MEIFRGIWLDYEKAVVVTLQNGRQHIDKIESGIEMKTPKGGSRSRQPYGPMENIDEDKFLQRRKQQEKDYFERLARHVSDSTRLYLFGPAEAKQGLARKLEETHRVRDIPKQVETSDSMTDNQIAARVRAHFNIPDHWIN